MNFENLLPSRFGRNWTFVPGRRPLVVGAESISKKREGTKIDICTKGKWERPYQLLYSYAFIS
jgi:hypothetical protein